MLNKTNIIYVFNPILLTNVFILTFDDPIQPY